MSPTRALLITGATGTQGGALISALLSKPSNDFLILAVTRNPSSPGAQRTLAKSPSKIRLVQGDLNNVPALFEAARVVAGDVPIWGVFSVQAVSVAAGDGWAPDKEVAQGKAMVDAALKCGTVRHFVYTSVDRGGDEASWNDPTPIAQFQPKHHIEQHLRSAAAAASTAEPKMGWTVLRPVSFMDNMLHGFQALAFYAMFRDNLPKDKPLQWVASADIGWFAAEALSKPDEYNGRAIGLAGDELTFPQLGALFTKVTGKPFDDILGGPQGVFPWFEDGMKWMVDVGYKVDVQKTRKLHPGLTSMEDWLKKSPYANA